MVTWAVGRKFACSIAAGTLLLLAACSRQPGGLTDEWPAMPEPVMRVPAIGTCHNVGANGYAESFDYTMLDTVPSCDTSHKFETIHVGQFEGEHAQRELPPPRGGPGVRLAHRHCGDAAREWLGGDWHAAWVWLTVFVPSEAAWQGGARWFRCDLAEIRNGAQVVEDRTTSTRDGLRGEGPLAITCASGDLETTVSVYRHSCADKHSLEFVGVYVPTVSDLAVGERDLPDRMLDGCWDLGLGYLGVPPNRVPEELYAYYWDHDEDRKRGDFSVRCFLGVPDRDIRGGATLKGLGSRPLPMA